MICSNCPKRCENCKGPNCCCQHGGNAEVRALSQRERHEFMLGLRSTYLLPAGSPYVAPVPKAVIQISSNGAR